MGRSSVRSGNKVKLRYLVLGACSFFMAGVYFVSKSPSRHNEDLYLNLEEVEVPVDINFPVVPESVSQNYPFKYFNDVGVFEVGDRVMSEITPVEYKMLEMSKEEAAKYLEIDKSMFKNGNFRHLGNGVEYDLTFHGSKAGSLRRVLLFQPLAQPKYFREIPVPQNKIVNIVMSLKGKFSNLEIFVNHFVTEVLRYDKRLTLTIAYFKDGGENAVKELLSKKFAPFPSFQWTVVLMNETKFSRGKGIQAASQNISYSPSNLLFFCDVDVLMKRDFFTRCRANAIEGHQVYYPIVFSLYNPKLVYALKERNVPSISQQMLVGKHNGFWRHFGYGMTCQYKGDFDKAGGIPNLSGWGGEDLKLFDKIIENGKIKAVRSPDPSLFHLHHHKDCRGVEEKMLPSCLMSKVNAEGSQLELGLMLLRRDEGYDIEGILSKRFYYFWVIPFLAIGLIVCLVVILFLTALIFWIVCVRRRPTHLYYDRPVKEQKKFQT